MAKHYRLPPEEFEGIYSRVPRLCVELIIRLRGGIILTLRALSSWNNQWHLPGGTVFYQETIEEAIARVARDEVGLRVKTIKPLGYIEYPSEERARGFGWSVGIPILCVTTSGKLTVGEDSSQAKTFSQLPENCILEQKAFLTKHWDEIFRLGV